MGKFDSSKAVQNSDPAGLLKVLNLDETLAGTWSDRDRHAILRHQLSAPLRFDGESKPSGIQTFGDLLSHSRPPLAPLKQAKDFFKQQSGTSSDRNPLQQVFYLMYLLTLVVARLRLEQSITTLADSDFRRALEWSVQQDWLDDWTRATLLEGQAKLISPE